MTDTERIDKLEGLLWSDRIGNGIAIFPSRMHESGETFISLDDLGDQDGSDLGDSLAKGPTLRDAIDVMIARSLQDQRIHELEELLRSACCIAERKGKGTHWERFIASVNGIGLNGVTARTYRILPIDEEPK